MYAITKELSGVDRTKIDEVYNYTAGALAGRNYVLFPVMNSSTSASRENCGKERRS